MAEPLTFDTGDTDLDALLFETSNMTLGPAHSNMDTAIIWNFTETI